MRESSTPDHRSTAGLGGLGFESAASLVALGFAALAFVRSYGESFWIDEVSSVDIARRGWRSVLELFAYVGGADVHPPAFYALLSGWGARFGMGEVAARALPAVLTALALWTVARAGRRAFNPAVGVAAAAVLGALPVAQHYAVEVRMYALALLATAGAIHSAVALTEGRAVRRWAVALTMWLIVGLLTAYVFAFVAVGIVVATSLFGGREARGAVAAAAIVAIAVFSAWLPSTVYQMLDLPAGFTAHLSHGPDMAALLGAIAPGAGLGSSSFAMLIGAVALVLCLGAGLWLSSRGAVAPSAGLRALGDDAAGDDAAGDDAGDGAFLSSASGRFVIYGGLLVAVVSVVGPMFMAAALPLPDALAELYAARVPVGIAATASVALVMAGLVWLGARLTPRRGAPARVVGLSFLLALGLLVAASLARPLLSPRTVLPASPLAALAVLGAAWRTGRWRALAAVAGLSVAISLLALAGPDRVAPRPDLRAAATAASSAGARPVIVLPRWEINGIAHYAPALDALPADDIPEVEKIVRHEGRATVILGRWAVSQTDAIVRRLLAAASPGAVVVNEGEARGFRWFSIELPPR